MASEDGVEQYLQEIQEGSRDSSGTFTLDWERARRRFEAEARKDPYRYLVFLLQFALSASPHRIDLEVDEKSLKMTWQPQEPTDPMQLNLLLASIETGEFKQLHSRLNYLRQSLVHLAGRDDLTFIYHEAQVGRLELGPSKACFGPPDSAKTCISLSIQKGARRLGTWSIWEIDLFHAVVETHWPEVPRLTKALTYPNSFVLLNGTLLRCPGERPHTTYMAWAQVPSTPQQPRLGQLPNSLGTLWSGIINENGEEEYGLPDDVTHYHALYLLGDFNLGTQGPTYRCQINLVQDGMVVHTCSGGAFGMVIFCAVNGLPMDLDGLQAVQGPELLEIVESLRAQSLRLEQRVEGIVDSMTLWRRISVAGTLAGLTALRKKAATEKAQVKALGAEGL